MVEVVAVPETYEERIKRLVEEERAKLEESPEEREAGLERVLGERAAEAFREEPPQIVKKKKEPESLEAKLKRLRLEKALEKLEEEEGLGAEAKRKWKKFSKAATRSPEEKKNIPFAAPEPPTSQIEEYWENEAQDFEPFGEQRDIESDAAGVGVLKDPFESPSSSSISIFSPAESFLGNFLGTDVFSPQTVPVAIVQEVKVTVPGGLSITHILQNAKGETGYRLVWQGEAIDWFPPVEAEQVTE